MREKDIVEEAMKEAGFNLPMVSESLGYKTSGTVWGMIRRSKTLTVSSFVRILGCMGFKVVVIGRGKEWEIDVTEVEHGKYKRVKERLIEEAEKAEPEKFFEKEKGYRMINGRKVVEVAKGVWRYE